MLVRTVDDAGVNTIAYAFPQVKIVTSAVDPEINEKFHVLPGIGNFGDRLAKSCLVLQSLVQVWGFDICRIEIRFSAVGEEHS